MDLRQAALALAVALLGIGSVLVLAGSGLGGRPANRP
jgi:hypothetical protein